MNMEAHGEQTPHPKHSDHWVGLQYEECIKEIEGKIHIPANAMSIKWGNNANFWKWNALAKHDFKDQDKFGFETAAELHQVSWLEVKATVDLGKHPHLVADHDHKEYEVVYHIKFKGDAFGWRDLPVTFVVITPNGGERHVCLNLDSHGKRNEWVEMVGGVFQLPAHAAAAAGGRWSGKIELGMVEVTSEKWKGGLILAGVTIRPHISVGNQSTSQHV